MQLTTAYGAPYLFFSLRIEMVEDRKVKKVYKIKRMQAQFEEEALMVDDPTVNMLIPRSN